MKTPVILVINKIDTVKKDEIIKTMDTYKDVYRFKEIIPVSAMRKTNTDTLIRTLFQYLPEGPQYYDEDTVTDQPMRQIAAELIREKALRLMSDEIPHGIAVVIERMEERDNGIFDIEATIVCERQGRIHAEKDRHRGPDRDRESDGRQGQPAALGQGPQGMAGQRALYEELRV